VADPLQYGLPLGRQPFARGLIHGEAIQRSITRPQLSWDSDAVLRCGHDIRPRRGDASGRQVRAGPPAPSTGAKGIRHGYACRVTPALWIVR
jgi:hypothetical protein